MQTFTFDRLLFAVCCARKTLVLNTRGSGWRRQLLMMTQHYAALLSAFSLNGLTFHQQVKTVKEQHEQTDCKKKGEKENVAADVQQVKKKKSHYSSMFLLSVMQPVLPEFFIFGLIYKKRVRKGEGKRFIWPTRI